MESTTESKASDESSSPSRFEMKSAGGEEEREGEAETTPPPRPAGPPAPPPPVDAGMVCWLQVVGAFGIWLNVSVASAWLLLPC